MFTCTCTNHCMAKSNNRNMSIINAGGLEIEQIHMYCCTHCNQGAVTLFRGYVSENKAKGCIYLYWVYILLTCTLVAIFAKGVYWSLQCLLTLVLHRMLSQLNTHFLVMAYLQNTCGCVVLGGFLEANFRECKPMFPKLDDRGGRWA